MALLTRRPKALPVITTVLAVALLLGLGTWQVFRKFEKLELKADIAAGMAAEPTALPLGVDLDVDDWKWRRLSVTGTFAHEKEIHLWATSANGNQGFQIITPLQREDGSWVMLNRGWVPDDQRYADARPEAQLTGVQTITGIAVAPWRQGYFVFDNLPDENFWFWGDLPGMAKAASVAPVLPFYINADESDVPGGFPKGGQTNLKVVDNHVGYFITWYGLAIGVLVIFILYHRRPEDG